MGTDTVKPSWHAHNGALKEKAGRQRTGHAVTHVPGQSRGPRTGSRTSPSTPHCRQPAGLDDRPGATFVARWSHLSGDRNPLAPRPRTVKQADSRPADHICEDRQQPHRNTSTPRSVRTTERWPACTPRNMDSSPLEQRTPRYPNSRRNTSELRTRRCALCTLGFARFTQHNENTLHSACSRTCTAAASLVPIARSDRRTVTIVRSGRPARSSPRTALCGDRGSAIAKGTYRAPGQVSCGAHGHTCALPALWRSEHCTDHLFESLWHERAAEKVISPASWPIMNLP